MLVALEYLENSLKQNLTAVFWIDSSLFIFNKVWGCSIFNDKTNHNLVTITFNEILTVLEISATPIC